MPPLWKCSVEITACFIMIIIYTAHIFIVLAVTFIVSISIEIAVLPFRPALQRYIPISVRSGSQGNT